VKKDFPQSHFFYLSSKLINLPAQFDADGMINNQLGMAQYQLVREWYIFVQNTVYIGNLGFNQGSTNEE
jgi:hypothetical protein